RGIVALLLLLADDLHQPVTLADGIAGDGVWLSCPDVIELQGCGGLWKGGFDALRCDAHQPSPVLDVRNELVPRPDGEIFNGCFVHRPLPPTYHSFEAR